MKYSLHLRSYRRALRLKQQDVAKRIGLKDSSLVSRWETGFSLPDLENAFRLAAIYNTTVDSLFGSLRPSTQSLGAADRRVSARRYEKRKTPSQPRQEAV